MTFLATAALSVHPAHAREPASPWEARGLDELAPPATLAEARARRDELTTRGGAVAADDGGRYEVAPTHPVRASRPEAEPLTGELRRLHLTVSAAFLGKLEAARVGRGD